MTLGDSSARKALFSWESREQKCRKDSVTAEARGAPSFSCKAALPLFRTVSYSEQSNHSLHHPFPLTSIGKRLEWLQMLFVHAPTGSVPAAPPHADSTGNPTIHLLWIIFWKTRARVFHYLSTTDFHFLPPLPLDPSHTNLDEGVNFSSPAFGKCFNLHLANRAHIQMIHCRATPKPEHKRGRGMQNCRKIESFPALNPTQMDFWILHRWIFTLLQTVRRGAPAALFWMESIDFMQHSEVTVLLWDNTLTQLILVYISRASLTQVLSVHTKCCMPLRCHGKALYLGWCLRWKDPRMTDCLGKQNGTKSEMAIFTCCRDIPTRSGAESQPGHQCNGIY